MNRFNIECCCKVSLEILVVSDEMLLSSSLKWEKQDSLLVKLIESRNVLEKDEWYQYRVLAEILNEDMRDLKFEMLLTSSLILKKSDWIAEQTDASLENSQESKMTQILIWDCQYWRSCRRIDWFSDSIIEAIFVAKERCRFAMINRYVLWSILK